MKIKYAAGGVLLRNTGNDTEVCIIHRRRYDDWTLPKGKIRKNEEWESAALREVKEETGYDAEIVDCAGMVSYEHSGGRKVVIFWEMVPKSESNFRPSEEVDQYRWVKFVTALSMLDYPQERELVGRYVQPRRTTSPLLAPLSSFIQILLSIIPGFTHWVNGIKQAAIRRRRLETAIHSTRIELQSRLSNVSSNKPVSGERWSQYVMRMLDKAEDALLRGDSHLNEGWRYLHEAQENIVYGYTAEERRVHSTILGNEIAKKLAGSWRQSAASDLIGGRDSKTPTAAELSKSMRMRNEFYENNYYTYDMIKQQIGYLGFMLLVTLGLIVFVIFHNLRGTIPLGTVEQINSFTLLSLVFLFGMVGGSLTTYFSLIQPVSRATIPEQMLATHITLFRPFLGGIAAIVIYVSMRAGNIEIGETTGATILLLSVVAGFSERLLIGTLKK